MTTEFTHKDANTMTEIETLWFEFCEGRMDPNGASSPYWECRAKGVLMIQDCPDWLCMELEENGFDIY